MMRIMELVFPLPTKLLHQIFFLQFTSPKDGPKGHLLSLKRTPDVPVLTAFPAGSFHFCLPGFPDAGRSFGEYALPRALQQPGSCQWIIICAPQDHVVKLTYQSFEVEESEDCFYDAMTVYEDEGKEEEIVKSCGFALSAPVPSSAVMLVVFHSDETETFGGFRATISFVHVAGKYTETYGWW